MFGRFFSIFVVLTCGLAACSSQPAKPDGEAFLGQLAKDVNPCVDFYDYVNKIPLQSVTIQPEDTYWDYYKKLQHDSEDAQKQILEADHGQLGMLYSSAMDEETIDKRGYDPIKPDLERIDQLTDQQSLLRYVEETTGMNRSPLLRFSVSPDPHHTDTEIVHASSSGGLGLSKDYYTDPRYAKEKQAYLEYIERSLKLIGTPDDQTTAQAQQVLDIEAKIADASLSPVEARDPQTTYHIVSLADADAATPHIRWEAVFAAAKIPAPTTLNLYQQKRVTAVDMLLASVPVGQWKAYLKFQVVHYKDGRLSKAFRDSYFEYRKAVTGQEQQAPRWQQALDDVNHAMGDALGKLYVEKDVDPRVKPMVADLAHHVLDAMRTRIQNASWLSDETRAKALEKLGKVIVKVAYPDTWRDWSGLVLQDGQYYENLQAADDFNRAYELAKLGKPTDKREWDTTPQTMDMYYTSEQNSITFDAAYLHAPYFDPNADPAINYGAVGSIIGHEITHGFDDNGRQYDGDGNLTNWWTDADTQQFKERTQKLVDQFNAYQPFPDDPSLHVNGQLTLGENIADLGGVLNADDALQSLIGRGVRVASPGSSFSPQQLYFLSFAHMWLRKYRPEALKALLASDPHSPDKFRVNGTVANVPGFAAAFGCKPGDPEAHTGDQLVSIW